MSEEYITKTQVRELMERYYENANLRQDHFLRSVFRDIKALPAADVAPVVRCKDCKYSDTFSDECEPTEFPLKCLSIRYGGVYQDWFCEHGQRKEDGDADDKR